MQYDVDICGGILCYNLQESNQRAILVFFSVDTLNAVGKHKTNDLKDLKHFFACCVGVALGHGLATVMLV